MGYCNEHFGESMGARKHFPPYENIVHEFNLLPNRSKMARDESPSLYRV